MKKSRYSRSDIARFSKIPANIAEINPASLTNSHLGNGKIGKVSVECRFLHEHTQWGQLQYKHGALSAGIIHMEIFFTNLHDCVLESATIRVVLDGDNELLQRYQKVVGHKGADKKNAVEVRQLGPVSITGTPFGITSRSLFSLAPHAEFSGFGGGLGEVTREKELRRETRWVFEGSACRHKSTGGSGPANSATWCLNENLPEGQPSHGNRFRTAFVFANDGRPFLLRVEVDGALRKKRHVMKEGLKKSLGIYRFDSHKDTPNTLVRGFQGEKKRLNKYADRLETDMDELNGAVDYNKRRGAEKHPQARDLAEEEEEEQTEIGEEEEEDEKTVENEFRKKSDTTQADDLFAELIKSQSGSQIGSENGLSVKKGAAENPIPQSLGSPKKGQEEKLEEERAVLYVWIMLFLREFLGRRIQYLLG
ncbi:hypothetical protein QBC34DRAFT_97487 [Podospora aff. communis PSN243]|uniref:C2 NT-type domain-containing protein n=1 Tax=Podospora aff. communis PSN243 TaxID=3040156 RepID=A0AAV9GMR9_9PEZI|nr:hypothetical protein QBC34DRAFT_97487 [Podospora aff. communis PSN243]